MSMTREHRPRPPGMHLLVGGRWRPGFLERCRRRGSVGGFVPWTEGLAMTWIGWYSLDLLRRDSGGRSGAR